VVPLRRLEMDNRSVQEALAEKAEHSVAERLRQAYDLLAMDEDDIESSFAIQAEALLGRF
jgi:hypothetical protein